MRFLIIFIVIVSAIMILVSFFFKFLRNFFGIFTKSAVNDKPKNEKNNVIYEKDDIVVLKGEAGKKKGSEDL